MTIKYDYTKFDLLKNPQKYQMSKFHGETFLEEYLKNRLEIIEKSNLKNIEINIIDLENIKKNINYKNLKKSDISTKNKIIEILLKTSQKENISEEQMIFTYTLIKKFEITKKIFDGYSSNLKKSLGKNNDIQNYLLFTLVCLSVYKKIKNLKFLNVILKLNDINISQKNLKNDLNRNLLVFSLTEEVKFVRNLAKEKGIKL